MEDEVKGEDDPTKEAEADRAFQEVHEFGFEVGVLALLVPGLECGAWHAGLLGKLSLGGVSRVKVVEGMGGLGPCPPKRLWRRGGVWNMLRESHGSWSYGCFPGKDSLGTRA